MINASNSVPYSRSFQPFRRSGRNSGFSFAIQHDNVVEKPISFQISESHWETIFAAPSTTVILERIAFPSTILVWILYATKALLKIHFCHPAMTAARLTKLLLLDPSKRNTDAASAWISNYKCLAKSMATLDAWIRIASKNQSVCLKSGAILAVLEAILAAYRRSMASFRKRNALFKNVNCAKNALCQTMTAISSSIESNASFNDPVNSSLPKILVRTFYTDSVSQFYPLDDPAAGKCVMKRNLCEDLSDKMCDLSEDCLLIDSCETNDCSSNDLCCSLSPEECQADPDCVPRGKCRLKPEFDLCFGIE